jgi:glycerol-3-phosphate acyltransferase PlsY
VLEALLIVLVSYLVGAIPVAYLTARALRGVDLREYGSKNVGASNVFQAVSRWMVVPVGLAEIAQGMAGILLAKLADQDLSVQVAAGLAAVAGHNWSAYLRFTGGRGIAHAIGFMTVLSWPALGAFTAVSLFGVLRKQVPLYILFGILVAPLAAIAAGQSIEIVVGLVIMAGLLCAKRVLTNDPSIPSGLEPRSVLVNRLLYDRDTRERDEWVRRGIENER